METAKDYKKTTLNSWQKISHVIFYCFCLTKMLDFCISEDRNLLQSWRGVILSFCNRFGSQKLLLIHLYLWEMALQQFSQISDHMKKRIKNQVKYFFGKGITPARQRWIQREVTHKISAKSGKKCSIHSKFFGQKGKIFIFGKKHLAHWNL